VDKQKNKETGFAHQFYVSPEWIRCRRLYADSVGRLCERCYAAGKIVPGTEVHHKIRLTPNNIRNPEITLNWDNLELLCDDCHKNEHKPGVRWRADEEGHVII
jgi:5-methylcytosine-specific restriction endonuclease McrA